MTPKQYATDLILFYLDLFSWSDDGESYDVAKSQAKRCAEKAADIMIEERKGDLKAAWWKEVKTELQAI